MKKVLLIFLAVVVLVVGGIVVAASMQPKEYRMERSISTSANPGAVYNVMCDFNRFKDWSPFVKVDPNAKVAVEGPTCGVGSIYSWEGNDDAGAGKMTIVNAVPNQLVDIKLEFVRPMPSIAQTQWAVAPEGAGSKITWTMSGTNDNLMAQVFGMLFMDKMLGGMFDEGLASLKKLAEASSY